MADPRFYLRSGPFTLGELASITQSDLGPSARGDLVVNDIAALTAAEPGLLTYAEGPKNVAALKGRTDLAAIVAPDRPMVDMPLDLLLSRNPHRAFTRAAAHFYPPAAQPSFAAGVSIDSSAKIEDGVVFAAGVVVGPRAELGAGTTIGPNSNVGPGVRIGRNCRIGANVNLSFAIIGDRVIVHPGASIGQDGFGYVSSAAGHAKVPQLGRVIIQDDVEIGACTTIDRGALGDTMIGEGAKIDNLVQIAHNCRIGRHVIITAQVGFAGSVSVGDFAVLGGQAGVADHLTIGAGARISAKSGVMTDVPAGSTYAGFPARPRMEWLREVAWLVKNVKHKRLDR